MMVIHVMILIILKLFQNRPAGDQRGPCGWPDAREYCFGDPCYTRYMFDFFIFSHIFTVSVQSVSQALRPQFRKPRPEA